MIAPRRPVPLPLLLLFIGLAVLAASLLVILWVVQAQAPEVTPTAGATDNNPPAKPTSLQASAEHDAVALTWTAATDQTVTHYAILRRNRDTDAVGVFHVIKSNAGPETGYTDGSVAASSRYIYRVKAVSPTGVSEWSGFVKADTPAAPDPTPTPTSTPEPEPEMDPASLAPTGLSAAFAEGSGVALSWTAPAEDADSVTGYEILRAVGEGELAALAADTGTTGTAYTDGTATSAGETYAYQVKAIRGEDRSQASGQAQVQVQVQVQVQLPHDPADLAPSNLAAGLAEGGGVALSWTAPAEDAASVGGYEVLRAVGQGDLGTLTADTASTDTTHTDATATDAAETCAYQVKAIRGQVKSQSSNEVVVATTESEAPDPPATPENLAPGNLTFEILEAGVALSWVAPAADAESVTGYRVLRRRPNQGENELLGWKSDTGSTETTYKDRYAQTHGEYYVYRVRALRWDEQSRWTNSVDVRRPEAAPSTTVWGPSNLLAQLYVEVEVGQEGVTTQVKLTWDAPAEGAEWVRGYEVQRATCDGGFTTLVVDTGSTATAYTDATAEAGEAYTYRVRARRPQGKSLTSNTWTVLLPGGTGDGACGIAAGASGTAATPEGGLTFAYSSHDGQEFNTLKAAGHTNPMGIWSDGTTMWVAHRPQTGFGDTSSAKLFSYNMATKQRDSAKDFNTLDAAGNDNPRGLRSDGNIMWVTDYADEKIYAYDMNTKARVPGEEFNNLYRFNEDGEYPEGYPWGIRSDGDIMWVVDDDDARVYAYDMDTKARVPNQDFTSLDAVGNAVPTGLWGDETTLFVIDRFS